MFGVLWGCVFEYGYFGFCGVFSYVVVLGLFFGLISVFSVGFGFVVVFGYYGVV